MQESPDKIVYVLTSDGQDIYADMNLLSVWSLLKSNPDACVKLLCDSDTELALQKINHRIINGVNEIIVIDCPAGSSGFRNRYMKTTMRRYVNGSFLYLDADTIIRDDLKPIFETNADFSAAPNHSGTGSSKEIPKSESAVFKSLNWPYPLNYVNGGVLYFSNHDDTYRLFDIWHKNWLDSYHKTGRYNDQPSLNSALNESKINFKWLDQRYNAQVHARPHTAWGAAIWHIYSSGQAACPKTVLDFGLKEIKEHHNITESLIVDACYRQHPWLINNFIDKYAINKLKKSKNIINTHNWKWLWLTDEYIMASKAIIRSYLLKMLGK